jgi:phosphinothricin acetyltransferase
MPKTYQHAAHRINFLLPEGCRRQIAGMDTHAFSLPTRPLPAIRIRPSQDEDIGAIAAIYGHHVRHGTASFEVEPPSVDEMRRRRVEILVYGLPYLVAEDEDGAILGYACAGAYRPRAAYANTVENSVYARHDTLRRGIGRQLLAELIARCEEIGLRQMVAVVGDSANLASVRLHEAFGFRLVGTLHAVGRKHGRWLDTVLLQRPLGEGDDAAPSGER